LPPSQLRALVAICCGDPLNPVSSLLVSTRPRMPARGGVGVEAGRTFMVVVVLLMLDEAVLWLAPQPARQAQTARQKRAARGRIPGP
jgi:hypothetical protein